MVSKCVIWGCANTSDSVIHYILPADPSRRKLWLQFIDRSNCTEHERDRERDIETDRVCDAYRVCADHFSVQHFTHQDLGFTTAVILNIDAVPNVYPGDHPQTWQAAGGADAEETCNIAITSTVSLACVKEEPLECDLSPGLNFQDEKPVLEHLKKEENTLDVSYAKRNEPPRKIKREDVQREPGPEEDTQKPFSCSSCEQTFGLKCALVQHELTHVPGRRQAFHCSHCGRRFAMKAFLKAHEKIHQNAESTLMYSCTLCPRRFRYKAMLSVHMRNHSVQVTYKCPICHEQCQYKAELSQHIKSDHTGSRLRCTTCDRRFLKVDAFLKHVDKHAVVTPYYCSLCKVYQLTERGYLRHMRIHKQDPDQTESITNQN